MFDASSSTDRTEDTLDPNSPAPESGEEETKPRKGTPASSSEDSSSAEARDESESGAEAAVGSGEEEDLLDESLPVPKGDEAKAILEALLFSATSPLSERRLMNLMNGIDLQSLREIIEQLRYDYSAAGRGITIMEVAGGYQLATRQEFAEWVFRLHKHRKRSALTPAVLETLAIIAYKQPIVRADVEAIRGVDCGGILRQLQDAGLVEVVGRKEVAGRPPLYGTSDLFLKSFGLKRLSDLPAIEELHTILAEAAGEETRREGAAEEGGSEAAGSSVAPEDESGPSPDAEDLFGGEGAEEEEEEFEEDEEEEEYEEGDEEFAEDGEVEDEESDEEEGGEFEEDEFDEDEDEEEEDEEDDESEDRRS